MDSTEQKALALLNEVCEEWNNRLYTEEDARDRVHPIEALCRAIEQHEAFRQEVSDAVVEYFDPEPWSCPRAKRTFARFIIAKPDPLVEALEEASGTNDPVEWANRFYAAIEKRGGKIVWGEG